jgi:hypothetical protein
MAIEANEGCLTAAREMATSTPPPGLPEWAKITVRFQSDADYCPCVQRKLVESMTPAFFELSQDQKELHVIQVMKDPECSVASIKNVFEQSCASFVEASITADQDFAKKLEPSVAAGICACMQENLRPISAKQWMDRTAAAFAPRAGGAASEPPKQIGKTPLEQAFAECRP